MYSEINAFRLAFRFLITVGFSIALLSSAYAQLIVVAKGGQEKGDTTPTKTFLWEGKDAKATLIYIPGGDGYINITPETPNLRGQGQIYQTLRRLSDPEKTTGSLNVVIFSSPTKLLGRERADTDHLQRIEDVILFYREKFKKPVWLMGHSLGSISVSEFVVRLAKENKGNLIQGMILSGSLAVLSFSSTLEMPVLFMHHVKDACNATNISNAQYQYEKVKDRNKSVTSIIKISTGSSVPSDPCESGYHMYNGAGEEVSRVMEDYLLKFY